MRQVILLVILVYSILIVQAQQENYSGLKSKVNEKSLPLVNITVDINKVSKEKYIPAEIEITDYLKRTNNNLATKFKCKIKYRGASSLAYEKKSFAIKLLNDEGKSLDASILGIREDDSWILNAMAVDRIRMRDRLLFDVWNDFSSTPYDTDYENRNGTKGYFVEVFINEEYHGLYCMTDKINRKLLGLKKIKEENDGTIITRGLLLKCNQNGYASTLTGYKDEPMDSEEWNYWELQYPDDYPSADTYTPLCDLIDFCTKTSDENFKLEYKQHFWRQNILDYHVFYLTFAIFDNFMKNTFLSTVDLTKAEKFMITPWDLDCSIGGLYDGQHNELFINNDEIYQNPFVRLWDKDVDGYRDDLYKLWQMMSKTIFSEEAIEKRMNDYAESFVTSGAWEREYKRWNGNPVVLTKNPQEELDYVKKWFHSNHINLNNYFKNINTNIPLLIPNAADKIKYNLSGQKVNENYKGIIIEDSKKKIVK